MHPIKVTLGTELKNLWLVKHILSKNICFLKCYSWLFEVSVLFINSIFSHFFHQVLHSKCLRCSLHRCSGAINVLGSGFCGVHPRLPGDPAMESVRRYFQRKNKRCRYDTLSTPTQTSWTFRTVLTVLASSENPSRNRSSIDTYALV